MSSTLDEVAIPNASKLVKVPIFNVYYGLRIELPFGHSAIFVSNKVTKAGWLFHIRNEGGGLFENVAGEIERRPSPYNAFEKAFPLNRKFTEFSGLEFTIWLAGLNLIDTNEYSQTPVRFQLLGFDVLFGRAVNCHVWAAKAAFSAVVISRKIVLK